ncbi:MAG: response regulator [Acidobacteria bacterium]|nr:response regulator [Acidobacteriota bacterium]
MNDLSASGVRVLLVDDDPNQLALSGSLLKAQGYAVVQAGSAAEALDVCRRLRPDLIISDVVMRDLDGFTLCSLLRADPALSGVPVVLVSAYFTEQEDKALAACAGASALVERTPTFDAELKAARRALSTPPPAPATHVGRYDKYPERMAKRLSDFLSRIHGAEARYRALLDHAQDAIALLTPEGTILDVSRRWEELRQMPREQIVATHIRDSIAPEFQAEAVTGYARLVQAGRGRSAVVPMIRADGSRVSMEFSTARAQIDGQDVILSIGRDVTEMVEARQRLEASERRYRSLLENTPDVVWTATSDGRLTFVSAKAEVVTGFPPVELLGEPPSCWRGRVHPDDLDLILEASEQLAISRRWEGEFRWLHKDDRWIWLHARSALVLDADGTEIIEGTFTDITERKRLAEQVRQSQKMDALGQLTGGIAHDFNNLLGVILGNGRLLLDDLPDEDPRRADAEAIIEASERAAALTRQLLMFSRRQIARPERLDVNAVVGGLERMLRRIIGEDISLSLNLSTDPGMVLADAGEIEQVVMNLVVNARDAMPGGGQLRIETANVELDAEYAATHAGVVPGEYVLLSVTDTGCGMDAETQRRAFEPFFTTKEKGHGTGLGLSTCYGIVQRACGHIAIYSEVGHGSIFKVYLPRQEGGVSAHSRVATPVDARGTETILLVEDDDQLRKTFRRALAALGYAVLDAPDGQAAVSLCERHAGPIHLVLSDMVMPGLSGPDTINRIRDRRPSAKVVFMSGYSDHASLRSAYTDQGVNFIQKPFTPQALGVKVREVLGEPLPPGRR